jgi:superfamily I DNA and/or RNA helicase
MEIDGASDNVRTIDSWQGREKEFMIFSAVRCNEKGKIGFLENYRRINVALTRAQHGLIIVGNAATLSSDPKWTTLIEYFKTIGRYVDGIGEAITAINSLKEKKDVQAPVNLEEDFW